MRFRSKLALGFAGILAVLLTASGYMSLRNVHILSRRLQSSFADSVVPLRNVHLANQSFNRMEIQLVSALVETGEARDIALRQLELEEAKFESRFRDFEQGATNEPAMQELLARHGVLEDQSKRQRIALDQVKNDYPSLKSQISSVTRLLRVGKRALAEQQYRHLLPVFARVDASTNALMTLEVEQGGHLDSESKAVAQSANRQILGTIGAAMTLGILLVLVVARSFTIPLLRLTAATEKVRCGDLEQFVAVESRDEVGQLAIAFNTMTDSLRAARTELEGRVEARTRDLAWANELLNLQIAERERTAEAFEQAKKAAEAANRAKTEFLAKMSHEIRTPMNGVMGAVELILATDLKPEQREYLEIASISAEALLKVINDILDFSKVESGKIQLEAVDFDLRNCLEDALATMRVRAKDKGVSLTCHVSPQIPEEVVGDPGRLRQILLNLVDNGIKFTEGGEVSLRVLQRSLSATQVNLQFDIVDTGVGIPADSRTHIFAPFEQADSSITRKHGGTGLGLAISAQLVELMGGSIWFDSEVGRGSTFHFVCSFGLSERSGFNPMIDSGLLQPRNAKSTGLADTIGPRLVAPVVSKRATPFRPKSHSSARWQIPKKIRGLNILIAEDNLVNQKIATRALQNWGHNVQATNNGKEALAKLDQQHFDLVLMDIQMPEMDGVETTRIIRESESRSGEHIPIVAVTAHAMETDRLRCLQAGMDDYVSKPLKAQELFETILRVTSDNASRMTRE